MVKITSILTVLLTVAAAALSWAAERRVPHGIAGVELGRPVAGFKARLRMESAQAVRFQEYLAEVELKPVQGIKTGLIAYGTCADPGRIVRIKIKYADSSKDFFDTLLKRYKARFGEPREWRGDPFHVMVAWKWSFVDSEGNHISLTLQHNSQDREQKMGNAVKLNLNNGIEAEHRCHSVSQQTKDDNKAGAPAESDSGKLDWEALIPR